MKLARQGRQEYLRMDEGGAILRAAESREIFNWNLAADFRQLGEEILKADEGVWFGSKQYKALMESLTDVAQSIKSVKEFRDADAKTLQESLQKLADASKAYLDFKGEKLEKDAATGLPMSKKANESRRIEAAANLRDFAVAKLSVFTRLSEAKKEMQPPAQKKQSASKVQKEEHPAVVENASSVRRKKIVVDGDTAKKYEETIAGYKNLKVGENDPLGAVNGSREAGEDLLKLVAESAEKLDRFVGSDNLSPQEKKAVQMNGEEINKAVTAIACYDMILAERKAMGSNAPGVLEKNIADSGAANVVKNMAKDEAFVGKLHSAGLRVTGNGVKKFFGTGGTRAFALGQLNAAKASEKKAEGDNKIEEPKKEGKAKEGGKESVGKGKGGVSATN